MLSGRFFELFQEFQSFITDHQLGEIEVSEYELTYINHIFERDDWKFPDSLGRVIEHLSWNTERYSFLPKPSTISWQARFGFSDGPGVLVSKLNTAKHAKERKDLLILELSALGLPTEAPLERIQEWFSHAHRWIVRGFEDLTSDEAQDILWGKT
jgi:uncharacterized protein (TIGR04255 family)